MRRLWLSSLGSKHHAYLGTRLSVLVLKGHDSLSWPTHTLSYKGQWQSAIKKVAKSRQLIGFKDVHHIVQSTNRKQEYSHWTPKI